MVIGLTDLPKFGGAIGPPYTPRFQRPCTYVVRKLGLDDYQLKLTCLQVLKVSGGNPKLPILLVCTIATQWTFFQNLINSNHNTYRFMII